MQSDRKYRALYSMCSVPEIVSKSMNKQCVAKNIRLTLQTVKIFYDLNRTLTHTINNNYDFSNEFISFFSLISIIFFSCSQKKHTPSRERSKKTKRNHRERVRTEYKAKGNMLDRKTQRFRRSFAYMHRTGCKVLDSTKFFFFLLHH